MSVRIPSDIGADLSNPAALLARSRSRLSMNAAKAAPAIHSNIQGILQQEQDRAMLLLSLSPLLSSLFIAYANKAAALEAASATPSPESEEWEALQNCVTRMREEIEKLKSGVPEASQKAFRSQSCFLNEENTTQQEIESLRKELLEIKGLYDQLTKDSSAEKAAHKIRIEDLETQRTELKQTVAEQQVKISKLLERQVPEDIIPPLVPTRPPPRPPARHRESLASSQATHVPRLQTPSPEPLETISNSSLYSNHVHEDNAPKPSSGPSETRPQLVVRTLPLHPAPKLQSSHKRSFRSGWLKALNDSF